MCRSEPDTIIFAMPSMTLVGMGQNMPLVKK